MSHISAQNGPALIYISRNSGRSAFVNKILARVKDEISGKILIKANLVSHEPYPTTTHPEMVEALLKNLQGENVAVGDGHAVDVRRFNIKNSAIYKVCEKNKVPFINFYENEMQTLTSPREYELTFSSIPSQYDYIISLPVLKIHIECAMTGALKNAFGYLAKQDRIHMHMGKKNIHDGIAELNTLVKPDLTIMDAVVTLLNANEVRHGGIKQDLGYLLAGKDPVALDAYGFTLLKKADPTWKPKSPRDIPHIRKAIELGVGNPEYQLLEIP
ncbi:MAG: DUF362 domain-containing protein [Candidatus Helarchaeota archaeon]|nr:DUF362 domain-containing protein [Candidatus Helarchaeota archaeon]